MKQANPVIHRSTGRETKRMRSSWLSGLVAIGVGASLMMLPDTALAQKKGGKKGGAAAGGAATGGAAAGGAATGGAAAGGAATGGAATGTTETGAAAGGDIEIDDPNAAKPTVETPQPAAPPAAVQGPAGGICDIDPSACPKQSDIQAAAGKKINAEIYAVQQIYALRVRRLELNPYWSFSLNDQFVSHPGPGLALNYYLSNVLAIGVNGNFYQPFNVDSDFNFQNRRATRVAVPLNEYQWAAAVNFTYVPLYGKFAGFGDFIFHYDAYVVAGVGTMVDRPIPIIDPDNRNFDWKYNVAVNAGLGLRIFFNRWLAATLEVRDYIFPEQLENTRVDTRDPQNKAGWVGDTQLTNNVQAQLGVSVFIPFSWDYRLPK